MTARGPLSRSLAAALKEAQTQPGDAAAVALAKRYAALLDEGNPAVLADIGPKYLAVLTALGMTPAGRGAKGGGPGVVPGAGKLDELRARRDKRRAG